MHKQRQHAANKHSSFSPKLNRVKMPWLAVADSEFGSVVWPSLVSAEVGTGVGGEVAGTFVSTNSVVSKMETPAAVIVTPSGAIGCSSESYERFCVAIRSTNAVVKDSVLLSFQI